MLDWHDPRKAGVILLPLGVCEIWAMRRVGSYKYLDYIMI